MDADVNDGDGRFEQSDAPESEGRSGPLSDIGEDVGDSVPVVDDVELRAEMLDDGPAHRARVCPAVR